MSDRFRLDKLTMQHLLAGLLAVGVVSVIGFVVTQTRHPASDTLVYELGKTFLQLFSVSFVGATVAAVTWIAQQNRTAAEKEREQARAIFELRAELLARSVKCAQTMWITCQHVSRIIRDNAGGTTPSQTERLREGRELRDNAYLTFSAESHALGTEIEARTGQTADRGAVVASDQRPTDGLLLQPDRQFPSGRAREELTGRPLATLRAGPDPNVRGPAPADADGTPSHAGGHQKRVRSSHAPVRHGPARCRDP